MLFAALGSDDPGAMTAVVALTAQAEALLAHERRW
jgi:hypothetical protein